MSTFRRAGDRVRMRLEPAEYALLRDLHGGLHELLEHPDRDDEALQRLFPSAAVGDDLVDIEVRALIHDDLLRGRMAGLDALIAILDRAHLTRGKYKVTLEHDEVPLVLGVLNDLRLTLGARIGIEDIDPETVTIDHPAAPTLSIMSHLAWWQEQLIAIIDPDAVRHYEDHEGDVIGDLERDLDGDDTSDDAGAGDDPSDDRGNHPGDHPGDD